MAHTPGWQNFRRTQDLTAAMAVLIYAGALLQAFQRLPGGAALILQRTVVWPGLFLALSFGLPLAVRPLRWALAQYVWLSFQSGFGQSARSILIGIGVLLVTALLMYWQIHGVAQGGRYPAGVFSGYAAGIGILAAQAVLVRLLERDPLVRPRIEVG